MAKMSTLEINENSYDIVDDSAVHFTEQTLTNEQKAQARENIGLTGELSGRTEVLSGYRYSLNAPDQTSFTLNPATGVSDCITSVCSTIGGRLRSIGIPLRLLSWS